MISVKGLEKTFQSGANSIHALNNITFEVQEGEIFGMLGRMNSGKTTLARCLNLLDQPTNGTIIFDNCPITTLSHDGLRGLRQKIGLLTKNVYLLESRTIYSNIALSLELNGTKKSDIEQIVNALLRTIGLSDKAKAYPHILTPSQKQKVALARAMALKPKVLICDDIANFDNKANHSILQLLRDFNEEQNLTILYLSQDLDMIKPLCHRVAVLNQGEMVELGLMPELFVNPQSSILKDIIKYITRLELPQAVRKKLKPNSTNQSNPVVRLSFYGASHHEPLIAQAIQQFGLSFHVIQAHLESIHTETLGIMIAELSGIQDNIEKAIEFLRARKLYIEVLGYAARTY